MRARSVAALALLLLLFDIEGAAAGPSPSHQDLLREVYAGKEPLSLDAAYVRKKLGEARKFLGNVKRSKEADAVSGEGKREEGGRSPPHSCMGASYVGHSRARLTAHGGAAECSAWSIAKEEGGREASPLTAMHGTTMGGSRMGRRPATLTARAEARATVSMGGHQEAGTCSG